MAVVEGVIVGHCLSTRAHVGGRPALALGPIGVIESHRGRGIGSALMRSTIAFADESGEEVIGLVGDHRYYGRFGFVPGSSVGIEPRDPAWSDHFQVRLSDPDGRIEGIFEYPEPFMTLR